MAPQLQGKPGSQVLSSLLWGRQRRGGLWWFSHGRPLVPATWRCWEDDLHKAFKLYNHLGILLKCCSDSVGLKKRLRVCTPKSPRIVNYCGNKILLKLAAWNNYLICLWFFRYGWGSLTGVQAPSRFAETWWPRIASFTCAVVETGCQLPFSQAATAQRVVSGFQEGREGSEASWGLGLGNHNTSATACWPKPVQPRFRGQGNRHHLSMGGAAQLLCREVHRGPRGLLQPPLLTIHLRYQCQWSPPYLSSKD